MWIAGSIIVANVWVLATDDDEYVAFGDAAIVASAARARAHQPLAISAIAMTITFSMASSARRISPVSADAFSMLPAQM